MSDDTPTSPHSSVNKDMTVSDYRLQEVELALKRLSKEFGRFMERSAEKEMEHRLATERCNSHGIQITNLTQEKDNQIRLLHKRVDGVRAPAINRGTFWTAIAALISGIGSLLTSIFHKG